MYEKTPKITVTISMPTTLHARLKALAKTDNRPLSGEIRQILKGYLEYLDRGGVSWCSDWHTRGVEQYEAHD